ncbi:MAG: hypothetical protein AAF936_00580 [Pseudomonadota bacterium]
MKKLLFTACLLLPTTASAEHWDVIGFKIKDECSFVQYMEIVEDFNEWGADYGYNAKVGFPLQSEVLDVHYWVGTSENAAAFGAAWDAWRDGLADSRSTPWRLSERFEQCSMNVSRSSYDVY